MVTAGDFKNGITIEYDGKVCQIVEFQHVKPGKGAAFVRTKLKDIVNGGVVETSFRPTEKFPQAHIERKDMTYLYNDGEMYNLRHTSRFLFLLRILVIHLSSLRKMISLRFAHTRVTYLRLSHLYL